MGGEEDEDEDGPGLLELPAFAADGTERSSASVSFTITELKFVAVVAEAGPPHIF